MAKTKSRTAVIQEVRCLIRSYLSKRHKAQFAFKEILSIFKKYIYVIYSLGEHSKRGIMLPCINLCI